MFIGENGERLLLPHFMELPRWIIDGVYKDYDIAQYDPENSLGEPIRNYTEESPLHYRQFIDACLGKTDCTAPFEYGARLTETILLGVIAGRFPGRILHYDKVNSAFEEAEVNEFLSGNYRDF